jgi:hypothetical protein
MAPNPSALAGRPIGGSGTLPGRYERRKERDMTGKFLLIVSDDKDGSHAEVAMLDTALEVERRVESLLAAGFDADRIKVFTGGQTGVKVTHQPVVHLVKRDSRERADTTHRDYHVEPDPAPVKVHDVGPAPVLVAASSYNTQPVAERRFSDLFRREYVG